MLIFKHSIHYAPRFDQVVDCRKFLKLGVELVASTVLIISNVQGKIHVNTGAKATPSLMAGNKYLKVEPVLDPMGGRSNLEEIFNLRHDRRRSGGDCRSHWLSRHHEDDLNDHVPLD